MKFVQAFQQERPNRTPNNASETASAKIGCTPSCDALAKQYSRSRQSEDLHDARSCKHQHSRIKENNFHKPIAIKIGLQQIVHGKGLAPTPCKYLLQTMLGRPRRCPKRSSAPHRCHPHLPLMSQSGPGKTPWPEKSLPTPESALLLVKVLLQVWARSEGLAGRLELQGRRAS